MLERWRGIPRVVLAPYEHRKTYQRRREEQLCVVGEERRTRSQAEVPSDADVVQHVNEVRSHGASEAARVLGHPKDLLLGNSFADRPTCSHASLIPSQRRERSIL